MKKLILQAPLILLLLLVGFVLTPPASAQTPNEYEILIKEFENKLWEGYRMNFKVKSIHYRYVNAPEADFIMKEVSSVDAVITMTPPNGGAPVVFDETLEVGSGGRVINSLPLRGYGDLDVNYLFYGEDDRVLADQFASITSSRTDLNEMGRPSYMNVRGVSRINPPREAFLIREYFKYDTSGRLFGIRSQMQVCYQQGNLPVCNVEGFTTRSIYYDAINRPWFIVFYLNYGPSNTWLLYNLKYDRDGEVTEYNLIKTPHLNSDVFPPITDGS